MINSENPTRFTRTGAVYTLYVLLGLYAFVQGCIGPAIPYLRKEFGLDYTLSALHVSAFAVGMISTGFFASRLLKRIGMTRGLWFGMAGVVVGLGITVAAQNPILTLFGILVSSVTGTLTLIAIQAGLSGLFPAHRSKALMEANIVASLFNASAPFVIAAGSFLIGWRTVFPFFVLVLAITAAIGFRSTRDQLPAVEITAPSAQEGRLPRAFWLFWVLIFLGVSVEWSLGFWAAEYLKAIPGATLALAAAGAGIFQIAGFVGRIVSSRVVGRISERRITVIAMMLVLAGFPLYWLRAGIFTAFAGLFLCGLGVSCFYPFALSMGIGVSKGLTEKASSYATIGSGLAILCAPFLLGRIADRYSLEAALWAIPAGVVLMAILFVVGRTGSSRTSGNPVS
jgi:fucose permease